ncbi:MAG: recombinase family protein [candidate division NC10 bacterium]|nr:recombinase family protein [candidate division NC10 bacterium]
MRPAPDSPTRALGYVRVSTEDQVREGVSLDVQSERIRAYCQAKGWTLEGIIRDEGRSARDLNRPGIQRVLEMARQKNGSRSADVLVVLKLDRLTRSVRDLGHLTDEFHRLRFGFTSIQEAVDTTSATGELFFNIVASISQWERRVIGERTSAALCHRRAQGQRISRDPFGWRVNGDGRTLHPVQGEQTIVAQMAAWRGLGSSYATIADRLNLEHVPPKRGARWFPSSVRSVLATAERYGSPLAA